MMVDSWGGQKEMNDSHWFEVYGMPGVRYMKDGKYYDTQKKLVSQYNSEEEAPVADEPEETVIEENEPAFEIIEDIPMPEMEVLEQKVDDDLELIDRIKIRFPGDPSFVKKSEIRAELRKAGIAFGFTDSRDELLDKLKAFIGLVEDV